MNYKASVMAGCVLPLMMWSMDGYARSVDILEEADGTVSVDGIIAHLVKDPNSRRESFNKDIEFRGLEGKITECKQLISLDLGANKNSSYGAFCELKTPKKSSMVTICNDEMVGHLAIKSMFMFVGKNYTPAYSKIDNALVEFTEFNCVGG